MRSNQPLAHHDQAKAADRIKASVSRAKVVWIGKLTWSDREWILNRLKNMEHGRK